MITPFDDFVLKTVIGQQTSDERLRNLENRDNSVHRVPRTMLPYGTLGLTGYTVTPYDTYIGWCGGTAATGGTISLPGPGTAGMGAGRTIIIKDEVGGGSAYPIVIQGTSAQNFDANVSVTISTNYGAVGMVSSGTAWKLAWQYPVGTAVAGIAGPHEVLSLQHTDSTPASVSRGDLITGQGANPSWARYGVGGSASFVRSDGVDTLWSTGFLAITATKTLTVTESLTLNALPVGGLAVATAANTLGSLAVGLTTQVLVGGGAGTVPAWSADLPTAVTIGAAYIYRAAGTDVAVADGGTGVSTLALNGILFGNAANALGVTAIGAQYQVLTVGASPFVPVFSGYLLDGTAGGKTILAVTNTKTLTLTATDSYNLTIEANSLLNQDLTTDAGPSFAHLHLTDLAALYTPAESWIGPSSTTGIYFKGNNVGIGTTGPSQKLHVVVPYAKTDTTRRIISAFGSNDATQWFGLFVDMTGAAAIANRSIGLQTADDTLANGGNLVLQPLAGNVGIGTIPDARLHSLATTEQLRLGYDAAKYCSFTVGSGGILTVTPIGGILALDADLRFVGAQSITTTADSLTLAPAADLDLTPGGTARVRLTNGVRIQSDNYVSQTTGWGISYAGGGDFRYLYADELHAKAFIADLEQALAGGQIICKSVAPQAAAFTVPAAEATATLVVESFKGFDTFRVFVDGDLVRLRQFERGEPTMNLVINPSFEVAVGGEWVGLGGSSVVRSSGIMARYGSYVGLVDVVGGGNGIYQDVSANTEASHQYTFSAYIYPGANDTIRISLYDNGTGGSQYDDIAVTANTWVRLTKTATFGNGAVRRIYILSIGGTDFYIDGVQLENTASVTNYCDGSLGSGYHWTGAAHASTSYRGGTLDITNCWGTVTWTSTDTTAKTQTYSFSRSAAPNAGAAYTGAVIGAGTMALDYGTTGNGYLESNAMDGAQAEYAPYHQIVSWLVHPASTAAGEGLTVRTRLGNLKGIFNVANEYGLYAGAGVTDASQYLRISDQVAELHNLAIKMYDGAVNTVLLSPTAPSFAMGATLPTAYGTGTGIWMGKDTSYKFRVGDPAGTRLQWTGTALEVYDASLKLFGATASTYISIGLVATAPTAANAGTGIWIDRTGMFGLAADAQKFKLDATTGGITAVLGYIGGWTIGATRISSTNVFIDQAGQYISMGATPPTAYGNNVGIWMGVATNGKLSLYADANNYLQYNGAVLTWKAANTSLDASGNLTATSATLSGAITATSGTITGLLLMNGASSAINIGSVADLAAGTGIFIDYTGLYGFKTNVMQSSISATTGAIMAGANAVKLDVLGIAIIESTAYEAVRSYRITDGAGVTRGAVYGYGPEGLALHSMYLEALSIAGLGSVAGVVANAPATYPASAVLYAASNSSTVWGKLTVFADSDSATPIISISGSSPVNMNIDGGLNVGGTSDPGATNAWVAGYARIGKGLRIGSIAGDAADDGLIVDGAITGLNLVIQGVQQDTVQTLARFGANSSSAALKAFDIRITPGGTPSVLLTTAASGTDPTLGFSTGDAAAQLSIDLSGIIYIGGKALSFGANDSFSAGYRTVKIANA